MSEGARWLRAVAEKGSRRHLDAPGEGREGARGQAEHGEEVARRGQAFFGLADAEGGGAQGAASQPRKRKHCCEMRATAAGWACKQSQQLGRRSDCGVASSSRCGGGKLRKGGGRLGGSPGLAKRLTDLPSNFYGHT